MNETHLGDVLHAYVDNELSVERALEARAHLESCPRCQKDVAQVRALREALRRTLQPAQASPAFLNRLRRSVRQADPTRWRTRLSRAAWAAAPLSAAALVVLFTLLRAPAPDLVGEVVAAHLRSLEASHLTDVASSDRHTVKPWFQGRIGYSLAVRDFADQGFPLEGGRVDYLDGQSVAALVYRARQHAINVFSWPAHAANLAPRQESRNGIQALHWVSDGMAYWLVSDASDEELRRLAGLLRAPPP